MLLCDLPQRESFAAAAAEIGTVCRRKKELEMVGSAKSVGGKNRKRGLPDAASASSVVDENNCVLEPLETTFYIRCYEASISINAFFLLFFFTLNQVAARVAMLRNMFLLCFTLFGEILKNKHLLIHTIFSIKRTGINFFQTAPVPEC